LAKIAAIRWQSSKLWRAAGTRNLMVTCAKIWPSRTCCWIASGRISTSASRRDTQLTLRFETARQLIQTVIEAALQLGQQPAHLQRRLVFAQP
jgi:hypothetical protein